MTKDEKLWAKVEAAYRAGMSVKDIRAKYKVAMGELMKRIADGGWTRAADDQKKAEKPEPPATNLPAVITVIPSAASAEIKRGVDAALSEVIESHKLMSRQLRDHYMSDLADYQALHKVLAKYDPNVVADLMAKGTPGQPNAELQKYLQSIYDAHAEAIKLFERIARNGRAVVELERTVWGLDRDKGAGAEKEQSYDDALDELTRPLPPPAPLPPNVVEFEQRIRARRKGPKDDDEGRGGQNGTGPV